MKNENVVRIIVVFLAGAKNKVLWFGKDVSKHFYWVAWPPMKWPILRTLRKILGFKVIKLDELRSESLERLIGAVYEYKRYSDKMPCEIVIPDSYSPLRKKNIGDLAKEHLAKKGIPENKILVLRGGAVGTSNKVETLAKHLYSLEANFPNQKIILTIITGNYNMERVLKTIRRELDKWGMTDIIINDFSILPLRTDECLKDELYYNLWAEKWKTRIEKIPWLARFFEWMERKGRKKV